MGKYGWALFLIPLLVLGGFVFVEMDGFLLFEEEWPQECERALDAHVQLQFAAGGLIDSSAATFDPEETDRQLAAVAEQALFWQRECGFVANDRQKRRFDEEWEMQEGYADLIRDLAPSE